MDILVTCKYEEDLIKNKALELSQHFPIISLWEISVAMETRVLILSGPKPYAYKISLRLAHWLRIYSSLKMFTHRHTDDSSTGIL